MIMIMQFVQREQVFLLLIVCYSLFLHGNKLFHVMFNHQIYFGQFLLAHFPILEIDNLYLTFALSSKRDSKSLDYVDISKLSLWKLFWKRRNKRKY